MKRLTLWPLAFLMALFLSLTASAADYAIHSATLDGGAVTVSVTAPNDCALWVGAYSADGVMISADGVNLSAERDEQTLSLRFGDLPTDAYARAFLLNTETSAPSCVPADTRKSSGEPTPTGPVYTSDVYAILYADGTMVFQHGDTPESGREVKSTYAVDMTGSYNSDNYAPWYSGDEDSPIVKVEFADKIQPRSTAYWFFFLTNLKEISNLDYLDTSHVTDMSDMFAFCWSLDSLDLSSFNTANVTNMGGMFWYCYAHTLNVSSFDTSHVTDMGGMFGHCIDIEALDVSGFDTSNVTDMHDMFSYCSLTTLDLGNFNTSNVTDMNGIFSHCLSLEKLEISHFDTSNVTNMSGMFALCWALDSFELNNFSTANVTDMSSMFWSCKGLKELDLSVFNTANVTDMGHMFGKCWALESINLSSFNTANVTDMSGMFSECTSLTALDVSRFNTTNVTDMEGMFDGCSSLTELDVSGFNTANVTNMSYMFDGCSSLTKIYASDKFVTNQVTKSDSMFYYCASLVGGADTTYDESHIDVEYARIDGGPDNPGYFTVKS